VNTLHVHDENSVPQPVVHVDEEPEEDGQRMSSRGMSDRFEEALGLFATHSKLICRFPLGCGVGYLKLSWFEVANTQGDAETQLYGFAVNKVVYGCMRVPFDPLPFCMDLPQ
jgi:hypothetical protein